MFFRRRLPCWARRRLTGLRGRSGGTGFVHRWRRKNRSQLFAIVPIGVASRVIVLPCQNGCAVLVPTNQKHKKQQNYFVKIRPYYYLHAPSGASQDGRRAANRGWRREEGGRGHSAGGPGWGPRLSLVGPVPKTRAGATKHPRSGPLSRGHCGRQRGGPVQVNARELRKP